MSARSLASGTITFGLVTIPVKLYAATEAKGHISFNWLHKDCGSRVKQQYVCPKDQEVVSRDQLVKGYEFAPDQYVVFTAAELKAMEERATQTIDIAEFVPLAQVDPVFFDKPYYLAPDKGGDKAYHLLTEVMKETGRSALARYSARGKQYLVLVRPGDGGLVMQQLLYADEVRPFSEIAVGQPPALREPELKLARQLVEQISSETFEPTKYEDEVKKRIQADIQRKVEGHQIEVSDTPRAPAQIIDLMEALKASLAGGSAKGASGKAASAETGRKPARAASSAPRASAAVKGEKASPAKKARGGKR